MRQILVGLDIVVGGRSLFLSLSDLYCLNTKWAVWFWKTGCHLIALWIVGKLFNLILKKKKRYHLVCRVVERTKSKNTIIKQWMEYGKHSSVSSIAHYKLTWLVFAILQFYPNVLNWVFKVINLIYLHFTAFFFFLNV